MRVFKVYHFGQKSSVPFVYLFDRSIEYLNNRKLNSEKVLFNFEGASHFLDRIIKKFPELSSYVHQITEPIEMKVISNLNEVWESPNYEKEGSYVNAELLGAVSEGIPRSYPVSSMFYIFDKIDWYHNGYVADPTYRNDHKVSTIFPIHYLSPSIGVWYPGTGRHVWAVIEVSSEQEMLETEVIKTLISSFGKVIRKEIVTVPSTDEKNIVTKVKEIGQSIVKEYIPRLEHMIKELPFHYEDNEIGSFEISQNVILGLSEKITPKKSIIETFIGTGFIYQGSDNGVYTISKQDSFHNNIEIEFVLAPTTRSFECRLKYQSPLHFVSLLLPITRTIRNQDEINQYVKNARFLVEYLEETVIEELRLLYGPGIPWFQYY
ncbi:hypothetical protein M3194_30660 [Paenibacillus glycanilyticus]|uniref:hypothetical protein n=1 Tax=Paenibacillus glycanilyticus TaxID=126569 RepID=UPI00203B643B|nr:hypothetical protein [Paenibacillus glycanilyticus]MCM3631656.1 hypothetical protein [Paenibacillus glycanilyticus]